MIPGERLEDWIRKIPAEFENHLCQSPATRNAQSFLTHRTRKHCCRAALAIVADVVSDSADNDLHLPMKLSPRARDEGWTGLVLGPREAITAVKLKPHLQETFFDGLSGHPKTGQWWSGQNRPTGRGRGLGCFILPPAVVASLFSYANSEDHI